MHSSSLAEFLDAWDLRSKSVTEEAVELFHAAPGGVRTVKPFSQEARWTTLDEDRSEGCIRDQAHAYTRDGGLAMLYGNLAPEGAIVKTAGVPEELWRFSGPAKVFESQEAAVEGILGGKVKAGDVVLIRYRGPSGGPGMQEMLYPTSFLKGKGLGRACALVTDSRFLRRHLGAVHLPRCAGGRGGRDDRAGAGRRPGGDRHPGPVPGAGRPRGRAGGAPPAGLDELGGYRPVDRERPVSEALRVYAALATSASTGAVRDISRLRAPAGPVPAGPVPAGPVPAGPVPAGPGQ